MPSTHIVHLKDYFERVERYPSRKNVLTIGDSWFQYPLRTYLDLQSGIAANSRLGRRANILDDSAPGRDAGEVKGRIAQWRRVAGELAHQQRPFALILLSLGGNDVIGHDFRRHIAAGGAPDAAPWPWADEVPEVVRRWLDLAELGRTFDTIAASYGRILALRDELAPGATVVAHTYADVTPMDKPYTFGLPGLRTGPWIWKYLAPLGLTPTEQKTLVRWLLQSFHALLQHVGAGSRDPGRFVVLDTRLALPAAALWDNEIHPRGPGFEQLIDGFWMPALDPLV
ncbi:MAG TPA: hypothetical protein VGE64_02590 [Xanthomonadaceae bacterium]